MAVTIALAVLLVGFVIWQQVRTRPINPRQLVIPPLILAFLGITNLSGHPPDSAAADAALAASVLTGLVFGVARGISTRVWWSNGELLRKGTTVTLVLWAVAIVVRLLITVVARRQGVAASVTTGEIPLFLGITLAAQNLLIWRRRQEELTSGPRAPTPTHGRY